MRIEVIIPDIYVWMTEGASNRGALFKSYVEGYIRKAHPELQFLRIEGMKAICERREGYEAWVKANKEAKNSAKRSRTKS